MIHFCSPYSNLGREYRKVSSEKCPAIGINIYIYIYKGAKEIDKEKKSDGRKLKVEYEQDSTINKVKQMDALVRRRNIEIEVLKPVTTANGNMSSVRSL